MIFFTLLLQIAFINCSYVNETTYKIKYILNKCTKVSCDENRRVQDFVNKTLNFVERTERFGDFLKYFNTSECVSDKNSTNIKRHILNGLILHHELPHSHWLEYKSVFNKEYRSRHQELSAFSRWRENLRLVADHNQRYLAGEITYSLHLNQFGDWNTRDYFKKILKLFDTRPLFDPAEDKRRTTYLRNAKRKVPSRVDWRALGFKPKREEQWKCGACYAFAVTHALQAQLYKKHGDWGELRSWTAAALMGTWAATGGPSGARCGTPQELVLLLRSGILTLGRQVEENTDKGRCKYGSSLASVTRPKRWAMLPPGDEGAMEKALATIGPLAVAVNAAPFTFQLYRSGIYDDPFCVSWHLNHAMLLVGYTPQYWILLNWWGRRWGEDGYIRIRRGHNRCGVANMAAYIEL